MNDNSDKITDEVALARRCLTAGLIGACLRMWQFLPVEPHPGVAAGFWLEAGFFEDGDPPRIKLATVERFLPVLREENFSPTNLTKRVEAILMLFTSLTMKAVADAQPRHSPGEFLRLVASDAWMNDLVQVAIDWVPCTPREVIVQGGVVTVLFPNDNRSLS